MEDKKRYLLGYRQTQACVCCEVLFRFVQSYTDCLRHANRILGRSLWLYALFYNILNHIVPFRFVLVSMTVR